MPVACVGVVEFFEPLQEFEIVLEFPSNQSTHRYIFVDTVPLEIHEFFMALNMRSTRQIFKSFVKLTSERILGKMFTLPH